jgi:hypothetical protein
MNLPSVARCEATPDNQPKKTTRRSDAVTKKSRVRATRSGAAVGVKKPLLSSPTRGQGSRAKGAWRHTPQIPSNRLGYVSV